MNKLYNRIVQTRMYTPNFDNYEGLMDYDTYRKWVSEFYTKGRKWNSEMNWKFITKNYYAKSSGREIWEQHMANGGSHWTLFNDEGWQLSPKTTKVWKNKLQSKFRRMIRKDEFEMNLHKADIDTSSVSSSTVTPEEEYWKESA